jgi:AAA15 family ATPase/GTPase
MSKLSLQSLKLKNFKAIRNLNNTIKFTPLTVFIGNNGSGKSSLIEALEAIYFISQTGIDEAMNNWCYFPQKMSVFWQRRLSVFS